MIVIVLVYVSKIDIFAHVKHEASQLTFSCSYLAAARQTGGHPEECQRISNEDLRGS